MSNIDRTIAPIRPALTHLRQTDAHFQWQQWVANNKTILIAAAGVLAIVSIALLLASRYQAALPAGIDSSQASGQSLTTPELSLIHI